LALSESGWAVDDLKVPVELAMQRRRWHEPREVAEVLERERAAVEDRFPRLRAEPAALRGRGELVKQADRDDETADRIAVGIVPGALTGNQRAGDDAALRWRPRRARLII
jgi:hypothetical protein